MSEIKIMKQVQIFASTIGVKLLRNNILTAWMSNHIFRPSAKTTVTVYPGDVVLTQARQVKAGLGDGTSDLIGWHTIIITEAMVGSRVAVIAVCETKSNTGRVTKQQKQFIETIINDGGIGIIARSPDDLKRGIDEYKYRINQHSREQQS